MHKTRKLPHEDSTHPFGCFSSPIFSTVGGSATACMHRVWISISTISFQSPPLSFCAPPRCFGENLLGNSLRPNPHTLPSLSYKWIVSCVREADWAFSKQSEFRESVTSCLCPKLYYRTQLNWTRKITSNLYIYLNTKSAQEQPFFCGLPGQQDPLSLSYEVYVVSSVWKPIELLKQFDFENRWQVVCTTLSSIYKITE